jgi:hypothetical protein
MGASDETNKRGRLMKYYSDLLRNPKALAKYTADAARSHDRRLQGGDILEMQDVTFDSCLFESNKIGPDSTLTIDGIIYVASKFNSLIVKNSVFKDNDFSVPVNGVGLIAICLIRLECSELAILKNFKPKLTYFLTIIFSRVMAMLFLVLKEVRYPYRTHALLTTTL